MVTEVRQTWETLPALDYDQESNKEDLSEIKHIRFRRQNSTNGFSLPVVPSLLRSVIMGVGL